MNVEIINFNLEKIIEGKIIDVIKNIYINKYINVNLLISVLHLI